MKRANALRRIAVPTIAVAVLGSSLAWSMLRARSQSSDEVERLMRRASEAAAPRAIKRPLTSQDVDVTGTSSSGQTVEGRIGRLTDGSGNVVGYASRTGAPLKTGESAELRLPEGGTIVAAPAPPDGTPK